MNIWLRTVGFFFWLYWISIFLPVTILTAVLTIIFSPLLPQKINRKFGQAWAYIGIKLTFSPVVITGQENLPQNGCIIISNHQSIFDVFVDGGYFPIDFLFLAKKEIEKIPLVGYAMKKVGYLFIDRTNARKSIESLKIVEDRVNKGDSVLIYPEGSRSQDASNFLPFKAGTVKVAKSGKLDILPIVVHGTQAIKPTKIKRFIKRNLVQIHIMPLIKSNDSIHPAHVDTVSDKDKLMKIRGMMIEVYNQLDQKALELKKSK